MFEVGTDCYQVYQFPKGSIIVKTLQCTELTWQQSKNLVNARFHDSANDMDLRVDCTEELLNGKSDIFFTEAEALEEAIDRLLLRVQQDTETIFKHKERIIMLRKEKKNDGIS